MSKKIYQAICLVAALVLVCTVTLLTVVLYDHFRTQTQRELQVEAYYVVHGMEQQGTTYLDTLKDRTRRVTHIAPDGTVLYDNMADAAVMANHLDREEVREALESGSGQGIRVSETLAEETFYYAQRLSDGSVLRLSAAQRSVWALLLGVMQPVAVMVLLTLLLGALLANQVAKRIVAPINALDLEKPETNEIYEEVSPLLSNIIQLRKTIDHQLEEARQNQEAFQLITEHMSEGLLVIGSQTNLLSCNGAALRLLGAEKPREDSSVLTLNRSERFRSVVIMTLRGNRTEERMHDGERTYQLMGNPVLQEGKTIGAIVLIVDITEQAQRESLRREFSANVSHELKTPLTSISGFAELLCSGMVQPEDVPSFSRGIYEESQRLIHLVEDIIRLSALDEADLRQEFAPVDLYALAQQQAALLKPAGEKYAVTLSVHGAPAVVLGNQRILGEIVFNLCDNAIKYNRPGGNVDVTVTGGDTVRLTVRDNGIGIPKASQDRIFERFYRVDKSHSRDVSGTGLGLSIVKHGVQLHDARLTLDSVEGKGTSITVTFPTKKE